MKFNFDFFNPKQSAFAVQLNGNSIKGLQLIRRGGVVKAQGYCRAPLPKGLMTGDAISNSEQLAAFIEKTIEAPTFGKFSTRRVAITIPESKSFVRIIDIPHISESEVENTVLFEAESYVPMPMDQVYFDWKILSDNGKQMSILLVASPKETVDSYINVLESANLKVVSVEVESQSLCRALVPTGSKETMLIVDVDSFKTNLIMVELGHLQFSSSIPVAGMALTETIAKALGVTNSQAEAIKEKVGISNTPEYPNIRTALTPVLKNLSEEIKNIIKFHYDHSANPISKIVLSGATSFDKNFADFLSKELSDQEGAEVSIGNPWQNITDHPEDMEIQGANALRYASVIGLAIRFL